MSTLKYSRQRESILNFLASRTDHPTADTVYQHIREEFPNISLGTVYRNLSLLSEIGEIQKISMGDGADHFDYTTAPHYHFICTACHSVIDLKMETIEHINDIAGVNFDGKIEGNITYFYGVCGHCLKKPH